MKPKMLFLLLMLINILFAQAIKDVSATSDFESVSLSSVAFSDVNGDSTKDALITGENSSDEPIAKLYINDGKGNFTEEMITNFEGVLAGSIAFSDVNGDSTADVLITGVNELFGDWPISKLYTNDGKGNFTEAKGNSFEGVWSSSIAFSDVNGDGTNDLLISGLCRSDEPSTKLYINDGKGNFIEKTDTPFEDVSTGAIAFSDVNSDGAQDLLITGVNNSYEYIAKLYINDGNGHFTEMTGTPFEGVAAGSIAFSDVNDDGKEDVLITGDKDGLGKNLISKLYTNNGKGNFNEIEGNPFEGVWASSIAFSDINGDETDDVLITGFDSQYKPISKLYTNDGRGNFTEITDASFEGVAGGAIAFSDVNGDGTNDVLLSGKIDEHGLERITKLYTNDGRGNFTE